MFPIINLPDYLDEEEEEEEEEEVPRPLIHSLLQDAAPKSPR
jgi:hypothetical protein